MMDIVVRTATTHDLDVCRLLDGSSQSDSVWNMQQVTEHWGVDVRFSPVRLPRTVDLPYPLPFNDLQQHIEQGEQIFVAECDSNIAGFISMAVHKSHMTGTVEHLLVDNSYRRRKVGTALLKQAVQVARELNLRVLIFPCQAKNGPAINFCRRLGLEFCGYNEQHFAEHEVTLLFAYHIR